MRNPNSQTNALPIFREALLPKRIRTVPVVHLGEVDCGFVIWWRASRYGDDVVGQLNESVRAYMTFVDQLLDAGYPTVVITCSDLPTIDDNDVSAVAKLRREVTATLIERTDLTIVYNNALRREAHSRNLPWIDLTNEWLDPDRGVVKREYLSNDPLDHHMNADRLAIQWANELNALAQNLPFMR